MSGSANVRRPLAGVRVVELPGLAPVPFCGLMLADFGADVLVVERVKAGGSPNDGSNESVMRRGKRSMCVDFGSKTEMAHLRSICESADVLLDPFRPGVLAKIGLDPVRLMNKNSRLIIAMISSYGQDGPYSDRAGHDINFLALSGMMRTVCGESLRPPANLLGDFAGGSMLAAFAICAALFRRQNDGVGCILDCSMAEGIAYMSTFVAENADYPPLFAGDHFVMSGKCPIYRSYETKDGKFMAVGALEPKFHRNLFTALGLNADDAVEEMFAQPAQFTQKLSELFRTKTQAEWTRIFLEADACVVPVLDLDSVGDFPQHRYRNFFMFHDTLSKWIPGTAPKVWTADEFRQLQRQQNKSKI